MAELFQAVSDELLGVKAFLACGIQAEIWFQTTFVGLKQCLRRGQTIFNDGFRRTLVGLKPIVVLVFITRIIVSDAPLWG